MCTSCAMRWITCRAKGVAARAGGGAVSAARHDAGRRRAAQRAGNRQCARRRRIDGRLDRAGNGPAPPAPRSFADVDHVDHSCSAAASRTRRRATAPVRNHARPQPRRLRVTARGHPGIGQPAARSAAHQGAHAGYPWRRRPARVAGRGRRHCEQDSRRGADGARGDWARTADADVATNHRRRRAHRLALNAMASAAQIRWRPSCRSATPAFGREDQANVVPCSSHT